MTTEISLKKWTTPDNWAGKPWYGYYVFLGKHRDSDALSRANFDAGLAAVKAVMSKNSVPGDEDESATVTVVHEGHWAVGWIDWIAIHESDPAAIEVASQIVNALEDYPVVDEMLFSEYETTEAEEVWRNCYRVKERIKYIREHLQQFEFHDFKDMLGCVRGKYFGGYASELLH